MQAKAYFGSGGNHDLDNPHSAQNDEYELVHHVYADGAESMPKMRVPQSLGIHRPQASHRLGSHVQDVQEESAMGGCVVESLEDPHPEQASRADFYRFMVTDGNWTDLFATALGWMLLDFTCMYFRSSLKSGGGNVLRYTPEEI